MGSVASCNASMSLLKKIDISKKEPNTQEEIDQFKKRFYKELSYNELYYNDDIYNVKDFVEYLYDNFIESTKFIDIIDPKEVIDFIINNFALDKSTSGFEKVYLNF